MISSRKELSFYIKQDYIRNLGEVSMFSLLAKALYHTDSYVAYKYLKWLRYYEYSLNVLNKKPFGKILCVILKYRWHRLSEKYNVLIPPNVVGYGLRMNHIVVGGELLLIVNLWEIIVV